MRTTTKVTVLAIAVMALTFGAFADDATQTDWSGGDGVTAPVTDWEDTFDTSTDISWLALPGELHLSSLPITPVPTVIDGDFNGAYSVYAADVDGDGDMDVLGTAREADDIAW